MVNNKSLVIAGSVLTGVGSSLAVGSGLAYYFKYKQGNVTDSELFKSLVAFTTTSRALTGDDLTSAGAASATALAAATAATAATGPAAFVAATAFNGGGSGVAGAIALANTRYKELSLADTIDFYKFWIIYSSTFIENLDASNTAFADLITKLKAFEAASKKERDTIYALVSLFGAVGPAIFIAGVPTLVTGLVRSNKDKKRENNFQI
jgi:GH15 family glucan-1,4-alpha-glucosidase